MSTIPQSMCELYEAGESYPLPIMKAGPRPRFYSKRVLLFEICYCKLRADKFHALYNDPRPLPSVVARYGSIARLREIAQKRCEYYVNKRIAAEVALYQTND